MNSKARKITLGGLFIALGLILPYAFHVTGLGGPVFLPMHIPVLLCGFILGPKYGIFIGFITPFLNSIFTGMPPIFPTGISMSFELAAYGLISGYFYRRKNLGIYPSLIIAMFLGRIISGISNYFLITSSGNQYVFNMFLTSAFIKSIWGIIIQLIFIPIIIKMLEQSKVGINING